MKAVAQVTILRKGKEITGVMWGDTRLQFPARAHALADMKEFGVPIADLPLRLMEDTQYLAFWQILVSLDEALRSAMVTAPPSQLIAEWLAEAFKAGMQYKKNGGKLVPLRRRKPRR